MEILGDIFLSIVFTSGIYHLGKMAVDSIWNAWLTVLGLTGTLGDEQIAQGVYQFMWRVK